MEQNPFSEANSYSADKEITSIWYDLKADNCVHKNLQVDSVLHQKNQVHTLTLSFFNTLTPSTLLYPVSSIPCLTPEESSPHPHSQFLQYSYTIHTLIPSFFNTLSNTRRIKSTISHPVSLKLLHQKNQVHNLTPSFFKTLTPEEPSPHSHTQFL